MPAIAAIAPHNAFGGELRAMRRQRRLSQLALALSAEVSQRHLSFLESGRAQPSRQMVMQLATAMDLSMRARNRLLQSAGYAALHSQQPLTAEDMAPVREALDLLLTHHAPYPAIVVDRCWHLIASNAPMDALLAMTGDIEAMWQRVCGTGPRNILQLTLHPEGLGAFVANLDVLAPQILARTAREAFDHPEIQPVLDTVLAYPGLPRAYRQAQHDASDTPALPVVPMHLRLPGTDLRLFSMLTTFGTPADVTTDELRVELFFPADVASRGLLQAMSAGRDPAP